MLVRFCVRTLFSKRLFFRRTRTSYQKHLVALCHRALAKLTRAKRAQKHRLPLALMGKPDKGHAKLLCPFFFLISCNALHNTPHAFELIPTIIPLFRAKRKQETNTA